MGALAAGLILMFVVSALLRLRYPFPLEQLEGTMALGVAHVAHGLPLYTRPDFTFIPYMYSPAYFYVAAFVAKTVGTGLLALRLVSILSTLGCFAVIFALVFTETRSRFAALAGAGLYAAAYPVTHNWFDLGRVDSLYVFLVLVALLATRKLHPVLAALAWTLAFLAKQTIAPVAILMLFWNLKRPLLQRSRKQLAGLATFLFALISCNAWLDHSTHRWFSFYVYTVPGANSDLRLHAAAFFPSASLLAPFSIALVVIAAAALLTHLQWHAPRTRFYLFAGISITGICWFLAAHAGATSNTAMPAYAILAVAFGVSLARLLDQLNESSFSATRASCALLLLAVSAQLASQLYSPKLTAPTPEVQASQQMFVDWLRMFPGDVWVPAHPYEAVMAGKLSHPDDAAIHDAMRPNNSAVRASLTHAIQQAVDTESFDAIVLDRLPQDEMQASWIPLDWRAHYPVLGLVPGSSQANPFSPRPRYVLLPCRSMSLPAVHAVRILSSTTPPCPDSPSR